MADRKPDASAPQPPDATREQTSPPQTQDFSIDRTNPSFGSVPTGGVPGFPFLTAPQAPDEIGRLGDYRILGKLGEGGMGFVFRAEETALRRPVALKVMRPEVAAKAQAADRFLREGRAAAGLKSDHIITIYRADSTNGVPYLAMEFLEGVPLDVWMKRQAKPVPLAHALRIVKDTLRGLAIAHDKGLIHRDVKPANLWIEKGNSRIKLLDFGLTRSNEADMQITQEGAVVGTPAYMAPEQASGKPVDPRADLFSVGVLFYHLLAGKNPFARKSLMETLGAIGYEAQPPLQSVRPDVPKEYADFADRLLAKLPGGRPAHAKAAFQELAAIEKKLQDGGQTLAPSVVVVPLPEPDAAQQVWSGLDFDAAPTERSAVARSGIAPPAAPKNRNALYYGAGFAMFLVALVAFTLALSGGKPKPDPTKEVAKDDGKKKADPPPKKVATAPAPAKTNRAALRFAPGDQAEAASVPAWTNTIITIEAWATVEEPGGDHPQYFAHLPNGSLGFKNASANFYTHHGGPIAENAMPIGRRAHFAGVNDGSRRRLYIDGKLVAETTDAGQVNPEWKVGHAGPLVLGTNSFKGTIEAVRVSTSARYDKEFAPPATFAKDRDTFALYLFDEGQGDTLKDSSGNGYHAKIVGATWTYADPDRAAAEFILARGGSVNLQGTGAVNDLRNVESLPTTPFKVVGAFATAVTAAITDADLDRFRDLSALQDLQLAGTFTDAGLAKLTAYRSAGTLLRLGLISPEIADGACAPLAKLPALTSITVRGSKRFTGRGLADLKGSGLAWLAIIECTALDGAELAKLADLPKLNELHIQHGTLADDALRHVGALRGLKTLSLFNLQGIGDAGAKHLEGMTSLESLHVELSPFGEAAFESFAKLPKLGTIGSNNNPRFTEAAAKALAKAPALHTLALAASPLDDAGLAALAECKTLKTLHAKQTKITAAGAAAFRKARPDATLECDYEPAAPAGAAGLAFDGRQTHVLIPALSRDADGPITLEAFVTLDANQGANLVRLEGKFPCQLHGWPGPNAGEWIPNGMDHRGLKFGGGTAAALVPGRRAHVAFQISDSAIAIYVDGKLANTAPRTTSEGTGGLRGAMLGAGGDPQVGARGALFSGTLSEVRISKVLRYKDEFVPKARHEPDADTLALYHCDEGAGDELKDASANKHHGRIVAGKWAAGPDRKAAETLLALGSLVVVRVDGVEKPLRDLDEIAGKSIEVVSVNVNRNKFVNDDTLECLRGLRHLTSAQLTNTAAGDRALECLKDSANLETLILYNSKITDKGLDHLAGFSKLKNLNLTQLPKLSEVAVTALAAKLPQCRIAWNGGMIEPTK